MSDSLSQGCVNPPVDVFHKQTKQHNLNSKYGDIEGQYRNNNLRITYMIIIVQCFVWFDTIENCTASLCSSVQAQENSRDWGFGVIDANTNTRDIFP